MIHRLPGIAIGWLRALITRERVDRDLDEELRYFLDVQQQRLVDAGVPLEEARRRARLELGGLEQVKEACRESRSTNLVEDCLRDLRYGVRALRRSPSFAIVGLLTLALGIGASTAMFSQINAVFLTPLPMTRPGELRLLDWTSLTPDAPRRYNMSNRLSYPAYQALRDEAAAFDGVACWSGAVVNLGAQDRVEAHVISGNYFATVGGGPLIGRTITDADERAGVRVAVISHALWQRAFDGRPSVIGESIAINGEQVAVVGVMPRRFIGLNPSRAADIYLPLSMYSNARFDAAAPRRLDNERDWSACEVVARLKPGVPEEEARAQAEAIVVRAPFASDRGSGPLLPSAGVETESDEARRLRLVPAARGTDDLREDTSRSLAVLMAVTLVVLLIACANVAGLFLARVPNRAREVSTRLALGASRRRVARQLVIEGMVLAIGAGIAGIVLAYELNRLLPGLLGRFISGGADVARVEPATDLRVLLFAVAASATSALAFSVAPAVAATRINLAGIMRQAPPPAGTPRRVAGSNTLLSAQAALALMLLIGAGLLLRTVANLRSADHAEVAARTLHFSASPALSGHRDARLRAWFQDIVTELQAAPGVAAASGVGAGNMCVADGWREEFVLTNAISPGLFSATDIGLLEGRDFTWDDRDGGRLVAIVNQAFVREYIDGRPAVGETVRICGNVPPRTVVGVVADDPIDARLAIRPTLYIPFVQPPPPLTGNVIEFAVASAADPESIVPTVREAIARVDPTVTIFDVETGAARLDRSITRERLLTGFVTLYSTIALFLACLGLYGVLAYTVSRRTAEVGVRVALGARPEQVVVMILRESLAPIAAGLAVGVAGALVLTRWLEEVLFQVSPADPQAIAGAAVVFLVTAGVAALLPALRASRIAPMRALRFE